jgi:uncharacterized RDD family membrane protein YckC
MVDEITSEGDQTPPGLFRRLASIIYDGMLVMGLIVLAITLVVILLGFFLGWDDIDTAALRRNPFYIAYLCLVPALFFIGFWSLAGETLGMRAWRMRIVRMDGGRPTLGEATIRYLAAILSWAALGLGFLWVLFDRERMAWHDRLSGTRLVLVPKRGFRERPGNP